MAVEIQTEMENMKMSNGKVFLTFGIIHPLLGISPFAFGTQFSRFANELFSKLVIFEGDWPCATEICHQTNRTPISQNHTKG
jgi:hypothetical protein